MTLVTTIGLVVVYIAALWLLVCFLNAGDNNRWRH